MNLAWLEALRRGPDQTTGEAFAPARAARSAADPAGDATDLALLDLFEAEWLVETGTADPALRPAVASLYDRFTVADLAFEAARAELLLARLALLDGDLAAAQGAYAAIAAAAMARKDAETAYLAGVGQTHAYRAAGDLAQGRRALEAVISAVEATRGQLTGRGAPGRLPGRQADRLSRARQPVPGAGRHRRRAAGHRAIQGAYAGRDPGRRTATRRSDGSQRRHPGAGH